MKANIVDKFKLVVGLTALLGVSGGVMTMLIGGQAAIAQSTSEDSMMEPLTLVMTGEDANTRMIPGYKERFSDIVGSGAVMLNEDGEVTAYYMTVSGLESDQDYAYHFHNSMTDSMPTSCEGDKMLVRGETAGGVITDLTAIAPLEVSQNGVARVGSMLDPVELPEPVPLTEIGYLNIHPAPAGQVGPGMICANVRLNAAGFTR